MKLKLHYFEHEGIWGVSGDEKNYLYLSDNGVGLIAHMLVCWHQANPQERPYPDFSPKAEELRHEYKKQPEVWTEFYTAESDNEGTWGIWGRTENSNNEFDPPIAYFNATKHLGIVEDIVKTYNDSLNRKVALEDEKDRVLSDYPTEDIESASRKVLQALEEDNLLPISESNLSKLEKGDLGFVDPLASRVADQMTSDLSEEEAFAWMGEDLSSRRRFLAESINFESTLSSISNREATDKWVSEVIMRAPFHYWYDVTLAAIEDEVIPGFKREMEVQRQINSVNSAEIVNDILMDG